MKAQFVTLDHYATYLDLAKILVEKAKKDIKKSDDIKNSDIPIANTISENMNFKRGGLDTRTDALDRILDRNITIQLTANILDLNEKGRLVMGQSPDTDHFIRVLRKSGVRWKILNPGNFPVEFEFTGSKKELIPVISEWDAYDRSKKDLMKALENWNGDEEELWDIIS